MKAEAEIIVLGGNGFIGKEVVRRLSRQGRTVTVISRSVPSHGTDKSGIVFRRGDVADAVGMREALRGASVVIHLASGGGQKWADFDRDFVQGTRNVAEACLEHGVRRLIYASSIAALYLGAPGVVDETKGPDQHPQRRGLYSRAKIAAEAALSDMHAHRNLPVVVFRPGLVVGAGGVLAHGGLGMWPSDIWCLGWGRGRTPLPFVLVADVAAAIDLAIEAPGIEGKVFNLVGDVRLSAAEFVDLLAKRSRRNFRFYPQSLYKMQLVEIGKWALKCMARKAENPFPSFRDLKSRSMVTRLDCSSAKKLLGWHPNDDRDALLREAIDANLPPIPAGDLRLMPANAYE